MKKIISFIIITALMLSLIPAASYATDNVSGEDTTYSNALNLVSAINKSVSINTDKDKLTTREEFLRLALGLFKENYVLSEHSFTDVSTSLAPFVTYALKLGMIDEGIRFYPDEPISYEQAMRIAVVLTGYTPKALSGGYIAAAKYAELDKNLDSQIMTLRNAVVLLSDVLNTKLMVQTVYGENIASYAVSDKTFLQMYHNIDSIEGIVKSNEYTSLASSEKFASKGCITIGVTEFKDGNSAYLGYNVKAYYNKDTMKIVAMYPTDNNELILNDVTYDNGSVIKYYTGNKEQRAKLDSAFKLIYNGKSYTKSNHKDLINKHGVELNLLDYNGDNAYDVVFVWDFSYLCVNYTDLYNQRIFDTHNNSYLDFSNPDTSYEIFYKYSNAIEKIDFTEITEGSVITYCLSDDGKYCRMYVTDDSISGEFSEIDRNEKIMYVNGEKYRYNSYFEKYYLNTYGTFGSFSIAYDGTIVSAFVSDNSGYKYGFLVDAAPLAQGLKNELYLKIYSQDGKLLTLKAAEKIKIDGNKKDFNEAYTDVISGLLLADDYSKIIKFSLNDKGELYGLDTVANAVSITDVRAPKDADNSLTKYYQGSYVFKNPPYFFGEKFYLSSSSTIMIIPSDVSMRNDERYYSLGTYNSTFNDGSNYTVAAYDISLMGLAPLVVQVSGSGGSSMRQQRSAVMLGKSIVYYPEDGEAKTTYEVYRNGGYHRYTALTPEIEAEMNSVSPGDIMRLRISGGKISDVTLDYDLSENQIMLDSETANSGYVTMFKGYLDAYNGTNMNIITDMSAQTPEDVSFEEYLHLNTSRGDQLHITVVKNKNGDIISVTPNNLSETSVIGFTDAGQSADRVVVRRRADYPQLAVVYTFITRN